MSEHWTNALKRLGACRGAVAWARTQPDLATAWATCQRGDWMLWLLGATDAYEPWSDERKPLVACAVDCAELGLRYLPETHAARPVTVECLRVTRAWCRGEATREEVLVARQNAAAAAAYAAAAAAYAAAAAADAAYDAAAADAAYAYAAAYAADAARTVVLAECADIVRRHYPQAPQVAAQHQGEPK